MLKNLPVLLILFCFAQAAAQPSADLKAEQLKHPDDFLISTKRVTALDMSLREGQLYITADVYEEFFILKNLAVLDDEESVDYSNFYKLLSIEAYTLVPLKNGYKKVDVKEFKDRHVFDDMVFHNDVSEKVFTYPDLMIGAKKILHYKQEYTQAELLTTFFFASPIFSNSSLLTITADEGIDIAYKLFNAQAYPIQFGEKKVKNRTCYSWQLDNCDKIPIEQNTYSPRYYIPHILYTIKAYKVDGTAKNVLSSVVDLHQYYTRFLKNLNLDDNAELKRYTDSIIVGAKTEEEKIKKIYYWVKDNIRYIAFEEGFGGFIPRDATEVYNKRYGDCKDMANLLVSMIRCVGIKNVYHTWIGTIELPYTYEDIPSTSVDNHMIATYIKNGNYIFLDATSKYTTWGLPSIFIQTKEAMINIDSNTYNIVTVPAAELKDNSYQSLIEMDMHGDTLRGKGILSTNGYYKDYMLEMLSDYSGAKRMQEIKPYLQQGNNKFFVKEFRESNAADRDKNYEVQFDFDLINYGVNSEEKKYVNLFLDKYFVNSKIDTTRHNDMCFEYSFVHNYTVTLEVPDGYTIAYQPKNIELDSDFLKFSSLFALRENKLILTYSLTLKKMRIEKQELNKWNEFISKLQKIYADNIALKKNT